MSNENKDKTTPIDPDNLSDNKDEEKLNTEETEAFKKIMAEIGEDPDDNNAPDNASDAQPEPDDELSSKELEQLDDVISQLNENDATQAEVIQNPESIIMNEEGLNMDELDSELKKVIQEADSNNTETEPESKKDLSNDEQDAFEKIMAQIGGDDNDESNGTLEEKQDPEKESLKKDVATEEGLNMDELNSELEKVVQEAEPNKAEKEPEKEQSDKLSVNNDEKDSTQDKPAKEPLPEKKEPDTTKKPVVEPVVESIPEPAAEPINKNDKKEDNKKESITKEQIKHKKRRPVIIGAVCAILMIAAGIGLLSFYQNGTTDKLKIIADQLPAKSLSLTVPDKPAELPFIKPMTNSAKIGSDRLAGIISKIDVYREELLKKIEEIKQLRKHYKKGVLVVEKEIMVESEKNRAINYNHALKNKKIELGLKTIQRRQSYIKKLKTPFKQLYYNSEEMLYLKRQSLILNQMIEYTSGINLEKFDNKVDTTIAKFKDAENLLSIDSIKLKPVPLKKIWQVILEKKMKNNRLASESLTKNNKLIKEIEVEICKGNLFRKHLLAELSPETAQCLVKWTQKDLILNDLKTLSEQSAKILAKWDGNWLCLNGLSELTPGVARQLALWPGKRLSLNGLTDLSPNATRYLAQWKGEDLELIGLKQIGEWENKTIRLFVSEELRSKITASR